MKYALYLITLISLALPLHADDWDIVRNDGLYTYVGADSSLSVIKILKSGQVSNGKYLQNIFSPEVVQGTQAYPICVIEHGSGWLGRYVYLDRNGMQLLVNKNRDTIRFKIYAMPDDEWTLMKLSFGKEIRAKVIQANKALIPNLNVLDSIKIIEINEYDDKGNLRQNSPVNGKKFYLSKSYGLILTFDIYNFPETIEYRNLSGTDVTEKLGIKPITFREVFDYNIGDEFHIYEGDTVNNMYGVLTWRRIKVLDKTFYESENIIDYEVDVKLMQINWGHIATDTAYADNIANMRIELNSYQDHLPNQSFIVSFPYDTNLTSNRFTVGEYGGRQVIRTGNYYNRSYFPCFTGSHQSIDYTYIEGCGKFFESTNLYQSSWKRLMYYQKSGKEYGKKLNFTVSVPDNNDENGISISPNPASDYIEINVPRWRGQGVDFQDAMSGVRIFDLLGVEQLPRPDGHPFMLEGEVVRIDVSSLSPGVYFVRVGDVVRKFVKI